MINKYTIGAIGTILAILILLKIGGDIRENKINAAKLEDNKESGKKAQEATLELNGELELLDEEASRIITSKPHNNTQCINPDVLRMLDSLTNKITDKAP